jgi:hypothetical protein
VFSDADDEPAAPSRFWPLRALVVAWLAWTGVRLVRDPAASTLFAGIDLGIHEAGHLLFASCGRFLLVAGGTILQLAAPIAAGVVLLRRGDRFGVAFATAWLGINLIEVSVYLSDARAQALPLVTVGGGEPQHDWTYLLGRLGVLRHDLAIGRAVRLLGFVVVAVGALWGGGLVVRDAVVLHSRAHHGARSRHGG